MIVLVFGTRPEAIKLGPVAAELRALGAAHRIICTGQHDSLLRGTPAEGDLSDCHALGLKGDGNPLRWASYAVAPIAKALAGSKLVVVQGDTMTAAAATRAAYAVGLPVAHVEAGVRSHTLEEPWPEEGFRREISAFAQWHAAATPTAMANLLAEGVARERIELTGNPGVSALARYVGAQPSPPAKRAYAMLTMHRREWQQHVDFAKWTEALAEAAAEHPALEIIWPVHPGVEAKLPKGALPTNVRLTTPLPYNAMIVLLLGATGVLTDSGGLCEEAATVGVPCAILRNVTDRPEAVEAGVARLFAPTPSGLQEAVAVIAQGGLPRRPTDIFGTPESAAKVARALVQWSA